MKLEMMNFILENSGIDITGKNAVICGRSKHVGLPIALLLHSNFEPSIGNQKKQLEQKYILFHQI